MARSIYTDNIINNEEQDGGIKVPKTWGNYCNQLTISKDGFCIWARKPGAVYGEINGDLCNVSDFTIVSGSLTKVGGFNLTNVFYLTGSSVEIISPEINIAQRSLEKLNYFSLYYSTENNLNFTLIIQGYEVNTSSWINITQRQIYYSTNATQLFVPFIPNSGITKLRFKIISSGGPYSIYFDEVIFSDETIKFYIKNINTNYTILPSEPETLYICDTETQPVTITLPPSLTRGKTIIIKRKGQNEVTIVPNSGNFIDTNLTYVKLESDNDIITLADEGITRFHILNKTTNLFIKSNNDVQLSNSNYVLSIDKLKATNGIGDTDNVLAVNSLGNIEWQDRAKVNLSNLSNTAVNTSIIPENDNSIDLGSNSKTFKSLKTNSIDIKTTTGFTNIIGSSGNYSLSLPDTAGKPKQVLSSDGSGNLNWEYERGVGDLSVYKTFRAEAQGDDGWTNQLTNAVFSINNTSPISGEKDYKIVMSSGASGSVKSSSLATQERSRNRHNSVNFVHKYDGNNGDFTFIVEGYNGSAWETLATYEIPSATQVVKNSIAFFVDDNVTNLAFKISVANANSGKELRFNDIEFTDNPFKFSKTTTAETIVYGGMPTKNGSNYVRFPVLKSAPATRLIVQDSNTDHTRFTVLRRCNIISTASLGPPYEGQFSLWIMLFDKNDNLKTSSFAGGGKEWGSATSLISTAEPGDYIILQSQFTLSSTQTSQNFSVTAFYEEETILTSAKITPEHYFAINHTASATANKVNFSNVVENTVGKLVRVDNTVNYLRFIVEQDCYINAVFGFYPSTQSSSPQAIIEYNGNLHRFACRSDATNGLGAATVTAFVPAKKGDVLSPHYISATLDTARGSFSLIAYPTTVELTAAIPKYLEIIDFFAFNWTTYSYMTFPQNVATTVPINSGSNSWANISSNRITLQKGAYIFNASMHILFSTMDNIGPLALFFLYSITDSAEIGGYRFVHSKTLNEPYLVDIFMVLNFNKTTTFEIRCIPYAGSIRLGLHTQEGGYYVLALNGNIIKTK